MEVELSKHTFHLLDRLFDLAELEEDPTEQDMLFRGIIEYLQTLLGIEDPRKAEYTPLGIAYSRLRSDSPEEQVSNQEIAISIFLNVLNANVSAPIAFYELAILYYYRGEYESTENLIEARSLSVYSEIQQEWRIGKMLELLACCKYHLAKLDDLKPVTIRMMQAYRDLDEPCLIPVLFEIGKCSQELDLARPGQERHELSDVADFIREVERLSR